MKTESCETNFSAVYSPNGWLDSETGNPTEMTAAIGDTLAFDPAHR